MLKNDITRIRKERHHITQEDFTPDTVVKELYSYFPEDVYSDFSKTILDPCCGTGNLLLYVIKERLKRSTTENDVYDALYTVYGTELMNDNVDECKSYIRNLILEICKENNISVNIDRINGILEHNIVHTNMFDWNYELWCSKNPKLF